MLLPISILCCITIAIELIRLTAIAPHDCNYIIPVVYKDLKLMQCDHPDCNCSIDPQAQRLFNRPDRKCVDIVQGKLYTLTMHKLNGSSQSWQNLLPQFVESYKDLKIFDIEYSN